MDVLSQAEIDDLLRSLQTGTAEEPQPEKKENVKKYDFRTANRFTKEHIRTVDAVYKNFGHLLSNYLVGLLRTSCEIEILSREEMSFKEFYNSVPSPSVVSIINMMPLGGAILFDISKEFAFSVVSRVLGGSRSVNGDDRQFTEIELVVMERVVWQILNYFDEAWGKIVTINSNLERIETSMQFAQICDNNEAVLIVTMNVKLGGDSSVISFCLPRQTMAPILKKLGAQNRLAVVTAKSVDAHPSEMLNYISEANVEIRAVFDDTYATTDDILRLQVGDVIQLNHTINQPLTVMLQDKAIYKATYGSLKNHYALKIQKMIGGEQPNGGFDTGRD